MGYAYLDANANVVGASNQARALAVAQGKNPAIVSSVTGAPTGLVPMAAHRTDGEPAFYHRKVSGNGTDISHYEQVPFLDEMRAACVAKIDVRTSELIDVGFTFDGKQFSLSNNAQMKMMGSHEVRSDPAFVYPVKWNTIDDLSIHSLVDSDALHAFYLTGVSTVRAHLDSGTELKDQIRATTSVAEIEAIEDNR